MPIRFPVIVLISTILLGSLIYFLHLFHLVTPANEVYARSCALGLFIGSFVLLGYQQARHHRFSWDDVYKNNTFIIVSLTALLASSFLHIKVGYYIIAIFVLATILHILYTRKWYPLNKIFYFVMLYALLQFLGTIGTEGGFRFPERTFCYYVLPLVMCCFRLPEKTLLRIAELFFKTAIIFLAICSLYWWFNFLHLDADFFKWITDKTTYQADMIDLKEPALKPYADNNYSAFFFVSSWSHHYHPSFISLVLFYGLILGFYLLYKKDTIPTITRFELILYIVLCFFVILLMESRIGVVGFSFIMAVTGLYYLRLKTKYFKISLIACLLLGGASIYMMNDPVSDFVDDDTRKAYRRIAVNYIHDHFWWGSGYRQERLALNQQAVEMKDSLPGSIYPHTDYQIPYVHNQFLGEMVQFGIWGLMILIVMLSAIVYYAIKNRCYLLQMLMYVIILFMMIEEPFYVQAGTVRFVTFLVFFVAICENRKNQGINTISRQVT